MGRQVEDAFLAYLGELALAAGATRLRGIYRPTAKNAPVHDFYLRHGFVATGGDEELLYEAELSDHAFAWPAVIVRSAEKPKEIASA